MIWISNHSGVSMEFASRGLRCNSVNPTMVDTDFYASYGLARGTDEYAQFLEDSRPKHPLQMIPTTDDCVNAISFLANDKMSCFITGKFLN